MCRRLLPIWLAAIAALFTTRARGLSLFHDGSTDRTVEVTRATGKHGANKPESDDEAYEPEDMDTDRAGVAISVEVDGEVRPSAAYMSEIRNQIFAQARQPPVWGEGDLVVVPAVYTRWGKQLVTDESGLSWNQSFHKQPFWAYEDLDKNRKVFLYQRLWPELPFFVPNYGYEGTIFLKFIIDHYDRLPPVMIFVQDDYIWQGYEDCLSRVHLTYRPLCERAMRRTLGMPIGSVEVEQCWRDFADIFELPGFAPKQNVTTTFYPRNKFAVGRGQIQRRPLSQWQAAYNKSTMPHCHYGAFDLDILSDFVMARSGVHKGDLKYDEIETKSTSGGALEHLSTQIYGFTGPKDDLPKYDWRNFTRDCQDFVPQSQCLDSRCPDKPWPEIVHEPRKRTTTEAPAVDEKRHSRRGRRPHSHGRDFVESCT